MPDLPPDTRRKLTGVLGMLGSDYAGERDAAAQLASRIVRGAGLTWGDLIAVPELGPVPQHDPPPAPPASWRELAQRCAVHSDWLSAWERQFLSSVPRRVRLSGKQAAVLDRIAAYLRRRGGYV
jgi:hypothetical protein